MKFLKLTSVDGPDLWINADKIVALFPTGAGEGTVIDTGRRNDGYYKVRESIDDLFVRLNRMREGE